MAMAMAMAMAYQCYLEYSHLIERQQGDADPRGIGPIVLDALGVVVEEFP